MDRLSYIAMSAAAQDNVMESALANNLANVDTAGYKGDVTSFKSLYVEGHGSPVRAYGAVESRGVDTRDGPLETTRRDLDIAMKGNAWLSVTAPDGTKGYVHTASLHVDSNGVLTTQEGCTVNSDSGFSITVPTDKRIQIDKTGGVNVIDSGQVSVIGKLKVLSLPENNLIKSKDGLVQVDKQGQNLIAPAQGNSVLPGALERSNVSPVDTLVRMMDLAHQYEANINMLTTARTDDKSANELLDIK